VLDKFWFQLKTGSIRVWDYNFLKLSEITVKENSPTSLELSICHRADQLYPFKYSSRDLLGITYCRIINFTHIYIN
jgi:hypothetical protein